MKKKILACALIAICLSMVAYGTTAFFSYRIITTNVITAGNVLVGFDNNDYAHPVDIVPGTTASRSVQITNIGYGAAWVRIQLDKEIILAPGVEGEADTSHVTYEIHDEFWTERDGWFYYLKVLEPGETTEPIFTEVSFSANMSNMYQKSQSKINVLVHAVQQLHNGESVFEAAGWPEE